MKRIAVLTAVVGLILSGCNFESTQFSFVSTVSQAAAVDVTIRHEVSQTEPDALLQARPVYAALEYRMVVPGFTPVPTSTDPVLPVCFGPLDNTSPAPAFSMTHRALTLSSGPSSLLLRERVRITAVNRACATPVIGFDFKVCNNGCVASSVVNIYFRAVVDDCSPYGGTQINVANCASQFALTEWISAGQTTLAIA